MAAFLFGGAAAHADVNLGDRSEIFGFSLPLDGWNVAYFEEKRRDSEGCPWAESRLISETGVEGFIVLQPICKGRTRAVWDRAVLDLFVFPSYAGGRDEEHVLTSSSEVATAKTGQQAPVLDHTVEIGRGDNKNVRYTRSATFEYADEDGTLVYALVWVGSDKSSELPAAFASLVEALSLP